MPIRENVWLSGSGYEFRQPEGDACAGGDRGGERSTGFDPRCDNGPEFTSLEHFLAWGMEREDPNCFTSSRGKPTQNGRVESFHARLREECLNVSWFQNLFDARRKIAAWRTEYNDERPHSSLGYLTPTEFAARSETTSYGKGACQTMRKLGKTRKKAFPTFPQLRRRPLRR